ncbi:DoxX family membrane protein [Rudanella paleaurantiibacter]|uniref:DoxX family membrane protein n=1 Tax=Rudanella paleaurantiibacter TaxID=2614655 RepID=A0A7J5U4X8_9BACT|nr:DoxX family membrane protein [Rudanella paleaurantiibacter]KAB7732899.1 DoxX family membrane protein [Rudanella paleaurantiibacter]
MDSSLTNGQLAALILRIGLGVNMLLHGAVRLPNLSATVEKMAAGFAGTILPDMVTKGFLYSVSFIEILIGLAILIGGPFGRWGYFAGGLLMTALMFGTSLKMDWATVATQVVYLIAFYLALNHTPNQRS